MRLNRIEIENFKGIGPRQIIELRPITLLFGPNSAGKSTILQALHYLREILERGNVDPDVTIAGGMLDLGGFSTLVHNHELERPVVLKVTLDLSEEQGAEGLPLNDGSAFGDIAFSQLPIRYLLGESDEYRDYAIVQQIGIEVEVRWSEQARAPYVARLTVELDEKTVASITSPPQEGRAILTDFDFSHRLLARAVPPYEEHEEQPSSPLEDEVWTLSREAVADRSTPDTADDRLRVGINTVFGALPELNRELKPDLIEIDEQLTRRRYMQGAVVISRLSKQDEARALEEYEMERLRRSGLTQLLDELILGPVRMVRDHLGEMTYIGPLREIPTRSYRPQVTPDEARWAQGLAAWDLLYGDRSGGLLDEVNEWLSAENRLCTGYSLQRVEFKEIPVPGVIHSMFERGLNEEDIGELQELYYSLKTRTEIALRDSEKGILVAPGDVGVGISQMVPVVVAALRDQSGILAIEQPELHIHPAIQVGMGDLFIQATKADSEGLPFAGKTLLIETHSEHILLRLLRRIRERTDEDLPPGVSGLAAADLSVIYVEGNQLGVRFRPLQVGDDGEFKERWPQGFFEERAGELF